MKNIKMGTYIRGDEACNFNFGTDLSIADKARFVNSVVDLVVNDEYYNSVIKNLVFDFYIIDFFTDIDTTELHESLSFVEDVEQFLDETNIVEIVKTNASTALFDELNNAVNKSIEYRTGIHPNPLNEALSSLMSTLEKKINEVDLNSAMGMAQKLNGMGKDFNLENLVNAYMGSDIHKKNLEEITEVKGEKI